jgi:glycosyltransferase involved in cell wall biosynthesis
MATQLKRFRRFLREREIEVVHTDGFYTNVFGITGATLARIPARVAFRGETAGWRSSKQDLLERCAYRLASVIHANSEAVKTYLTDRGVSKDRIAVIYNGVDVALYSSASNMSKEDLIQKLELPIGPQQPMVTIVANLRHEVKDHPMFLRAARRVHAVVPEAVFVIAGEGELMDSMRALAAELGIERNVFFIGRCDRVPELLSASSVCVLTSKAEGFSNSILEYMAAGQPVVVTDVGGAREAVVEAVTGYIVSSGDDDQMGARIIELLSDPARARAMGQRGREVVTKRFSSERQLEKTHALYEKLLSQKTPVPASVAVRSEHAE